MIRKAVRARPLAGLALGWLVSAGPAVADPLPAPSGPHATATETFHLVDPGRRPPTGSERGRPLAVQAWYPSEASAGAIRAPYVASWAVLEALIEEGYYDQTAERLAGWRELATHSSPNARPLRTETGVPLVLLSPGLGIIRSNYTSLAEELASFGFVVLVIDHPFGAVTRDGAGRVLRLSADENRRSDDDSNRSYEAQWAGDIRFVLDWSADARPGIAESIDFDRVAAVGHSLGGAAAFEACRTDDRFRACVNLDGFSFGAARQEGVGAPAMLVKAQPDYSDDDLARRGRTREEWNAMIERVRPQLLEPLARNDHPSFFVGVDGTGHLSFSDAPFVMPDTISRFGGNILAPARSHEVSSALLRAFLEEHLLDQPGRLVGVGQQYPEVEIEAVSAARDAP